MIFCIYI